MRNFIKNELKQFFSKVCIGRWLMFFVVLVGSLWAGPPIPPSDVPAKENSENAPGFYSSVALRPSIAGDISVRNNRSSTDHTFELQPGFGSGLSAGYQYRGFRLELEPSVLWYQFDRIHNSLGRSSMEGDLWHLSLMGNLFYEHRVPRTPFTPYAGIGAGPSLMIADIKKAPGLGVTGSGIDIPFAYQIMLGVKIGISDQAEFYTGYRFFNTFSTRPDDALDGLQVDGITSHSLEGGVAIHF